MTLQATTLLLLLMTHILTAQTQPIDLSGTWNLQLDPSDQMIKTEPSKWKWNDTMTLPGTTDLAKKGPHITKSIPYNYHLNREYAYTGPAYYSRTITIPEDWKNMSTQLILERVMWQSRVWIDGKEISPPQDSLNTAHKHVLGKLTPGQHQITVRIDNRMVHPIGDKGHAYGDQTQSIWNGIVGKIELRAVPDNHIDFVRVFPSNNGQLKVEVTGSGQGPLQLKAICINNGSGRAFEADIDASGHFSTTLESRINQPQTWSEFNPKTYQVQVDLLQGGTVIDSSITRFGFREVSRQGNQLLINGKPAFMRGNLECAVFPLTGHPPVTVEGWKKVWQVYKDHNLNHARFHSWCPPKAAFVAADELGIYLQVEAPIWIDHWMTKPNKRKEMDTLGHPKGLGHNDRSIDSFALAEIRRTIDTYGNHPSFIFFAIGNELGTSNFDVTGTWMRDAKKHDPRHLYAASTARTITPFCDFNATHNIPHIGWVRQKVNFGTNWDYEEKYSKASVPIISHEIGQWPVYVDWKKELPKYTGPLKPYRLMKMAEEAKKNGLYDRSEELKMASGASNRILYRDEIESFLRTPSCRGFQLLGMQDFSGQGEALIGWLDSFYDSKGTTDLKSFRHYCAPTVPLLKLPGYVYKASEKPSIDALIHHYGEQKIDKAAAIWKLTTNDGKLIDQGKIDPFSAPTGSVTPIGSFTPNMTSVTVATQATLSIEIALHSLSNSYDLWIYPEVKATAQPSSVLVTSDWEGEAKPALAEGKKVILIANQFGGPKASKQAHWFPLYWSVPFFPGQNRETIGLRISSDHPAFADFPTPSHGDWNWHRICRGAKGFDLTGVTPNTYRPIAEPVTDFHHNRRLGSIFETNVDKGKLLVCGYNISKNQAKKLPEVKQLRQSLIHYTSGKQFSPQIMMATEALDKLFHDPTIKLQKLPAKFTNADLYINAAGKVGTHGQTAKWSKGRDQILRQSEGVDYKVEADGVWRDKDGSAWHGKNVKVIITPRSGVPGKVLVRFHDWNKNGRTGNISFEGKTHHLGPHTEGGWVEFPFIREDTNDGQLILKAEAATGPNLMITDIVLIPEE
ncbi:glycoside hydrolase family 2 [Verrucomicrobiaceae bacterium N1E253]|uniref:beta-galactosidase n=1 Tax=Oceaniferula marina TaxID=2748318 RepID=A0A851GKL8_9BACT|nr:sugar-binding domain-containing protein [Oceaniferula marina]NWK55270.1 glycoside hydrolase family 2 [Oceaniferula marina]